MALGFVCYFNFGVGWKWPVLHLHFWDFISISSATMVLGFIFIGLATMEQFV
jgi:hypothetical protein